MDTRLRRISYSKVTKTIVFFVSIIILSVLFGVVNDIDETVGRDYWKIFRDKEKVIDDAIELLYNEAYINMKYAVFVEERTEEEQAYYNENEKNLYPKGVYVYAKHKVVMRSNCGKSTVDWYKGFEKYAVIYYDFSDTTLDVDLSQNPFYENSAHFMLAVDEEFLQELRSSHDEFCSYYITKTVYILVLLLLWIISTVYLCITTGKRKDKSKYLYFFDKLWTEILLGFEGLLVFCFFEYQWIRLRVIFRSSFFLGMTLLALWGILFFGVIYSLIRKLRNGKLIKGSFIYWLFNMMKFVFKTLFDITPLRVKIVGCSYIGIFLAFCLTYAMIGMHGRIQAIAAIVLILMCIFLPFLLIYFIIKPYEAKMADKIKVLVEKEMQAERFKTELITNVSHDLKTPLTAILNYSDLLLKENEDNKYARVINEKAQKLKALTEDLFEVSKAESGIITPKLEELDVSELINQILAENETQIDYKINVRDIKIKADGKLMSRVFENIIGNIEKYTMPGTRAYIDAVLSDERIIITFKNVSAYEMNFDGASVIERFSRGDASRSTDGNGLGLAIAQSYTELCGGDFNVFVDGDLFKVILKFMY